MGFAKNLGDYLSNPKKRNRPIDVCTTPNSLLAIGAKQLPVVMNPNDVDKCLGARTANKNKNSHELTVAELNSLPKLLASPVMIFKDPIKSDYITIVTDGYDKNGKPFIIGLELNAKEKNHIVNRIATMHGRDRAFESFIAKNGKIIQGYIPRNIAEGNLIAINTKKAQNYYQSTGLQLPEKYSEFISFDNSITHSFNSVKKVDENSLREIFEMIDKSSPKNNNEKEKNMENWQEKTGQEFTLRGSENGQKYTVLSVNEDNSINLRREDSWTIRAVNPSINKYGSIEWDYSTNGTFADEALARQFIRNGATEYTSRVVEVNNGKMNLDELKDLRAKKLEEITPELNALKEEIKNISPDNPSADELSDSYNMQYEKLTSEIRSIDNLISKELLKDNAIENVVVIDLSARVTPFENDRNLKGLATVLIDNQIAVNGVRIIESAENGLFVQLPQIKDKSGNYSDLAFPIDGEVRKQLNVLVLNEYQNPTQKPEINKDIPANFKIDVSLIKNTDNNNVKAGGQIVINDVFVIKNIKVVEKENGELFVGMPNRQNQNGEYKDIVHPTTKAAYEKIQNAVLEKYDKLASTKTIGNASYKELGGKDELAFRTLNNKFAEKVGKKLDEAGIKWSAKVTDKTVIAFNKKDEAAFKQAEKLAIPKKTNAIK